MSRTAQLHVMLSDDEMSSLRGFADSLGTSVSDTVRLLVQAGTASPSAVSSRSLALDRATLARYVRNVRALSHLLNQSTHALNATAKAVRESGVDALDLAEALESISYGLSEMRSDADSVRRQAAELTDMPVVSGGEQCPSSSPSPATRASVRPSAISRRRAGFWHATSSTSTPRWQA